MSMYRQLWLAIIVSMLLALVGSLLASLLSARSYLEQQLSMKNADNASALALSLSQQNPDRVALELTVAALFDSGHYEWIRINDPNGKLIIERVAAQGDQGAPAWFVDQLPIRAEPGEAQITNGWTQLGSVTLLSHSRFSPRAVLVAQRLVAALDVHDREPAGRQPHAGFDEEAFVVRTTMADAVGRGLEPGALRADALRVVPRREAAHQAAAISRVHASGALAPCRRCVCEGALRPERAFTRRRNAWRRGG